MKRIFKKSKIVFVLWALIGSILLVLISRFEGVFLQSTIGKIGILYVAGSCIISGVIHRMVKREKK